MKLTELLGLLPDYQLIEVATANEIVYDGKAEEYIGKDYIVTDVSSYGDVRDYDNVYSVISIGCDEL